MKLLILSWPESFTWVKTSDYNVKLDFLRGRHDGTKTDDEFKSKFGHHAAVAAGDQTFANVAS